MFKASLRKVGLTKVGLVKKQIVPVNTKRWVLTFNGTSSYGVTDNRLIDPDGDIDIEFYAPEDIAGAYCILNQAISQIIPGVEFRLLSTNISTLALVVGGNQIVVLDVATGYTAGSKYRIRLVGTTLDVWKGTLTGTPLRTLTFTRGTVREPTAQTSLGARTNGVIGTFNQFFKGKQKDVKVNGVLWSISSFNQAIQPSLPPGNNLTLYNTVAGDWSQP